MNTTLTLTKIGNSEGVILPKEIRDRLRIKPGDKLYITETPDGFAVRSFDPEFAHAMDLAEDIMRRNRNALRKLAE